MHNRTVNFGVIGCGLMGREFASAAARWCHLDGVDICPRITGVCDTHEPAMQWFADRVPSVKMLTTDYRKLLDNKSIEAVYCAVPHHLHGDLYCDILAAGKHLLGEKPFGIDLNANQQINREIESHSDLLVRCSSEFPFYPGAYRVQQWLMERRFGQIIEVEAGFWHSSDLNPDKPINWKRIIEFNGEYGCMGDLGLHVLHLPLRVGIEPLNVRALLSNIVTHRPTADGNTVPCETWDNAILSCESRWGDQLFPMTLSTKRIAPGHANTWFIRVTGTNFSCEYSTRQPKELKWMRYQPGEDQVWCVMDCQHSSAYKSITGSIFEFGFSDAILQMWCAFLDELANGRDAMQQDFYCATPQETLASHRLFTAALESQRTGHVIHVDPG